MPSTGGVGFVVVDSFQELALLEALVAARGGAQRILLRITPGIEAHTHSYIQTGQVDSKFGFGLADGVALEAIRRALAAPHLDLVGLHAHIGSQIFELDGFRKAIEILVDLIRAGARRASASSAAISTSAAAWASATRRRTRPRPSTSTRREGGGGAGGDGGRWVCPMPRVLIEPGRSIVGKAGHHRLPRRAPSRRSRASAPT